MNAPGFPSFRTCAVAALIVLAFATDPCNAAWGPGGVTVSATTASIPSVEGCSDGGSGAFVVWQEERAAGQGVLRAQHLLSNGDLDPVWPAAGAHVCDVVSGRTALGALPDHLGGFFTWWKEDNTLFVTRLEGNGQVAGGWPARGRSLGPVEFFVTPNPSVIEDGGNGIYAAWGLYQPGSPGHLAVVGIHLGPSNTGAGGWPDGIRTISPNDPVFTCSFFPQIALAPDGGIFLAHGTYSQDSEAVPNAFRLQRLTSAGVNADGWPAEGVAVGPFHADDMTSYSTSLLGLSSDGRGGAFVLGGNPTGLSGAGTLEIETRLYRATGAGVPAPDWPAEGRIMEDAPWYYMDTGADGSYRVLPDGSDGALAGFQLLLADTDPAFGFYRITATGQTQPHARIILVGHEVVRKPDGMLFLADFNPSGKSTPWDTDASLNVYQRAAPPGWRDFHEIHTEQSITWFKDVGLAPADDGAVLFWSQVRDRIGLFARRFTSLGEVTEVPDPVTPLALRSLHFVPGSGVRASLALQAGSSARIDLFDVAGRRVASQALGAAGGTADVVLAGTGGLHSGLYFARITSGRQTLGGKVAVAR